MKTAKFPQEFLCNHTWLLFSVLSAPGNLRPASPASWKRFPDPSRFHHWSPPFAAEHGIRFLIRFLTFLSICGHLCGKFLFQICKILFVQIPFWQYFIYSLWLRVFPLFKGDGRFPFAEDCVRNGYSDSSSHLSYAPLQCHNSDHSYVPGLWFHFCPSSYLLYRSMQNAGKIQWNTICRYPLFTRILFSLYKPPSIWWLEIHHSSIRSKSMDLTIHLIRKLPQRHIQNRIPRYNSSQCSPKNTAADFLQTLCSFCYFRILSLWLHSLFSSISITVQTSFS